MHTPQATCQHTNILPWGECADCAMGAADREAQATQRAYQAKIDAMTPDQIEAANAAARATYAAQDAVRQDPHPWRARSH